MVPRPGPRSLAPHSSGSHIILWSYIIPWSYIILWSYMIRWSYIILWSYIMLRSNENAAGIFFRVRER